MRTSVASLLLAAALLLAHAGAGAHALRGLRTDGTTADSTTTKVVTCSAPNPATATNALANATAGTQPFVNTDACSAAKSPKGAVTAGTELTASLSGLKNMKPNSTGASAIRLSTQAAATGVRRPAHSNDVPAIPRHQDGDTHAGRALCVLQHQQRIYPTPHGHCGFLQICVTHKQPSWLGLLALLTCTPLKPPLCCHTRARYPDHNHYPQASLPPSPAPPAAPSP